MTALIDLGNTALKWSRCDDPDSAHTFVHSGAHHFLDRLIRSLEEEKIQNVVACSVASRDLTLAVDRKLKGLGYNITWLRAQEVFKGPFTLINRYKNPLQLGPDRWHAAMGAICFLPNRPLLVVHVGTATTVDTVFPDDKGGMIFAGGRISPGVGLMRDSLVSGTATLPKADGGYEDIPTDTMSAIVTGIVDAQLGLIERGMRMMQKQGYEPTLVLAGGAAAIFIPYLLKEFPESINKHNLVLRGLALRARQL